MLDQVANVFYDEANELLDNLEDYLLTLESEPENQDVISAVFRAMHTIKGSSGMFGLDDISKFTHAVENTFSLVRNGIVPVSPKLVNLTLQARDHIRAMLGVEITPELQETSKKIITELEEYINPFQNPNDDNQSKKLPDAKDVTTQKGLKTEPEKKEPDNPQTTWRISFIPSPTLMQNGTRPELLVHELTEMGISTVITFQDKVPPLSQLDENACYLYWDIILTTTKSENDIRDVFIFVDDNSVIKIKKIENIDIHKKLGEILISRELISEEQLTSIINKQKKVGELLVSENVLSKGQIDSAIAEQQHIKKISSEQQNQQAPQNVNQTIRVNSTKLDRLVDLVGELVTFNARLSSMAIDIKNSNLSTLSELAESLIFSLRDTSMDMRMLPIGSIFSRFKRLVHDLSNDLGKDIELITEGAETELDKTVIEKLNDPLVHLIRNSCDHGIESPEKRIEAGKTPAGTVKLSARHAGAFVLITISDDGAGLNKEKILKKAIERGIVNPKDELPDQEIYNLIFKAGFSTADVVSNVSGRGVGMDVVKRDIDSLGGTVSIETNPGKGTNFILKIPLTLAIIDGMLVQIGDNNYIIPVSSVVECIEYKPTDEDDFLCSHITARDEYLPCINMRHYFELEGEPSKNQQVIIVTDQTSKVGIIVDKIIGNHQTVIKPLGKLFKSIQGLSGSTILGDGSVAIILDIFKLSDIIRVLDVKKK